MWGTHAITAAPVIGNAFRAMVQHTLAQFSGLVGGRFRVRDAAGGPVEVELIRATALGPPPSPGPGGADGRGRAEPFALVFRGPEAPLLPQRIYRFEHADLGTPEIFIVPIGPDERGHRYEAVFN